MKLENTKVQMRKGVLEYCILAIIDQREAYASEIIDTLKEAEMIVVEGTIYPLLTRLKNAKLLEYNWQESTSGPPRKYYQITDQGREFLRELDDTWKSLNTAVNHITKAQSENSK